MKRIQRASIEDAKKKALPIFEAGTKARGQLRAVFELKRRAEVKRRRDERRPTKPRVCAL
jgi:hypothetical protein